ncbi:hypothetical protein GYMLUDRAFT_179842, partial [Collybiopsis luxurians FD-317 M1]
DPSDGSDDNIKVEINKDSRIQLYLALSAVPEAQIREILKQLIEQLPEVEYALTKEFVVKKRYGFGDGSEPQRQRVRRIEVCSKCQEEFDADEERAADECCFHPGFFRPDYSKFVDWDEDAHGTIDSEEVRRMYPENYRWTCCQEYGDCEGCVRGAHQSANPHKKLRGDV